MLRHVAFPALLLLAVVTALQAGSDWTRTQWNDEPAWTSTHAGCQAVVSETRARLIYFGPESLRQNLLSAPLPLEKPSDTNISPNWGGHRFWLGPQSRWSWPPLKEWEFSEAAVITAREQILTVRHRRLNDSYPELTREYAWENGRLRCTILWRATEKPFYGMHVFAIDVPAALEVTLAKWEHTPHGLVGINGDTPNATNPVPHPSVTLAADKARIQSGVATAKLGVFPQTLRIARGERELRVHPGPNRGVAIETPDFGYTTQVWVGPPPATFAELEQITPFLLGDEEGWCGSTVFLELK